MTNDNYDLAEELRKAFNEDLQEVLSERTEEIRSHDDDSDPVFGDEETVELIECPECEGEGEIDLSIGPKRIVDCEKCDGRGRIEKS